MGTYLTRKLIAIWADRWLWRSESYLTRKVLGRAVDVAFFWCDVAFFGILA